MLALKVQPLQAGQAVHSPPSVVFEVFEDPGFQRFPAIEAGWIAFEGILLMFGKVQGSLLLCVGGELICITIHYL